MAYFTGGKAAFKVSTAGTPGTVGTATSSVSQTDQFSVEENIEMIEITQLGTSAKKRIPSYTSYTINASGYLDSKDAGIQILDLGDLVDFELAPENTESTEGQLKITGQAFVESFNINTTAGDAAKFTVVLSGDGALTKATY